MNTATREDLFFPLLSEIALFEGLTGDQRRFLAAECFPRQAVKGQVIFEKGLPLGGFYAVRQGRVKLAVLSAEGVERVVQIALPGETFGEALGMIAAPSPLYAQALCRCELLFLRAEQVRAAIVRWSSLGMLLLGRACEQVHALYGDVEACCLHTARQRVAGYLLDSFEGACCPQRRARAEIDLPAGKAVVASRLNLTPETLSRELRALCDEGLIAVERCTVRLHDLAGLRVAAARG